MLRMRSHERSSFARNFDLNINGTGLGVTGLVATLFSVSATDLAALDGAFGLSSAEWRVICFTTACVLIIAVALFVHFRKTDR